MKKILYLVLVAVLTVTAGTAWGQHTLGNIPDGWTVTADGNPVTVTSNGTAAIPAGATVTLTPLYPAKVKSVKLKDEGLLNGKFSISATNQVYFSQGNLQATYNGSAWSWAFATNQWDYIGNAEGNTKLTATTPFVSDYTGTSTTVDLFGWVGASSTWEGAAQYGITSSTEQSGGADGYGNIVSESLKSDWGTLAITNGGNAANNGWRTLTIDEWEWILGPVYSPEPYPSPSPNPGVNCRTSSTVGGTANARYAKATVADKPGLIIFPDSYTHPSDVTAPTNVNTYNADYTHNSYDATAWGKMESAGAVFLPAAGFRSGVTVNNAGLGGDYWSSSSKSDVPQSAYRVWLSSTILDPRYYSLRNNGSSVRLVKDAQIVNLSTLMGNYEAQNGDILINTLAGNYKITIADGATVTLRNATINGTNDNSYQWAGITCLGDATIVLEGTNTVKGFYRMYPGIQAAHNETGSGNEYTLTIKGTGALNASSNGYAPGIGGGYVLACGNIAIESGTITSTGSGGGAGIGGGSSASCGNITISGGTIEATGSGSSAGIGSGSGYNSGDTYGDITISGGNITATGGQYGAGIGSGSSSYWGNINITGGTVTATGGELAAGIGSGHGYALAYGYTCGNISITGGTVTATGGSLAAGIGSGKGANCGTVTITDGVTSVTATKASDATNSIGAGNYGSCGTVSIGGATGAITTSPYTYPTPPYNATTTPLTFEAKADGFTVTLYSDLVPLPLLEYSIDGGAWTTYTCNDATPAINEGHTISFRGNNTRYFIYDEWVVYYSSVFSCSRDCYLYGNIMSLVSASSYATASSVEETAFCWLFESNTNIYSHNTKELVLPATTLARYCYKGLFNGCTHLTTAPNLPAETLAEYCYESMFDGCEGLVNAPEISATTLAAHCCGNMFNGCTSLTTGPTLSATTLADYCYYNMFKNCSNLNSVTCLATTYLSAGCTLDWLQGVAATGTFTAANTSVGWSTGVSGIPSGWTRVNAQ